VRAVTIGTASRETCAVANVSVWANEVRLESRGSQRDLLPGTLIDTDFGASVAVTEFDVVFERP